MKKAIVTDPGKVYPDYTSFARKFECPKAAFFEYKPKLQKGFCVEILHSDYCEVGFLHIIQTINGFQYIINDEGLEMLPPVPEKVKLPREVGEALDGAKAEGYELYAISYNSIQPGSKDPDFIKLYQYVLHGQYISSPEKRNNVTTRFEKIMKAYFHGWEPEETPEERALDLLDALDPESKALVHRAFQHLNITVPGFNDTQNKEEE